MINDALKFPKYYLFSTHFIQIGEGGKVTQQISVTASMVSSRPFHNFARTRMPFDSNLKRKHVKQ